MHTPAVVDVPLAAVSPASNWLTPDVHELSGANRGAICLPLLLAAFIYSTWVLPLGLTSGCAAGNHAQR